MRRVKDYDFGAAIKFYREEKNITRRQLSRDSGVSYSMISMMERGERKSIGADSLKSISDVFGISCDQMLITALLLSENAIEVHRNVSPVDKMSI